MAFALLDTRLVETYKEEKALVLRSPSKAKVDMQKRLERLWISLKKAQTA